MPFSSGGGFVLPARKLPWRRFCYITTAHMHCRSQAHKAGRRFWRAMTDCDFVALEKGPPTWPRPAFNLLRVAMGVVGVLLVSAFGSSRQHFAQAPDKGQPNEEGNEEGSSFSVSPGLPLHLQFGFGGGPDPKPDPVVVGATEKRLPDREAFQKELKEAEANCKKAKKELKEAKKELKEAEAKVEKAKKAKEAEAKLEKAKKELKEAEPKLEKAEATGTKDVIKRAKQMFDMAVKGANSAQAGVDSAQARVDSARARLNSAQARVKNAQMLVDECIPRQANMNRESAAVLDMQLVTERFPRRQATQDQLPSLYVPRTVLVQETVRAITAEPTHAQQPRHLSMHFYGFRAAGKTCFLQLVAEKLLEEKKHVYFLLSPRWLESLRGELVALNKRLIKEHRRAYLLVDESQMRPDAFYEPLRSYDHITTVAVGRVALISSLFNFEKNYGPMKLMFSRAEFDAAVVGKMMEGMSTAQATEFTAMLDVVFAHTKGHAYGTMQLSWEFARLARAGTAATDAKEMLWDSNFIESNFYQALLSRCSFPSSEEIKLVSLVLQYTCGLSPKEGNYLLDKYCIPEAPPLLRRALLYKYDEDASVDLSEASFEQLILHTLRQIAPDRYESFGGVNERVLVYDVAMSLAYLKVLDGAPLWEPAPEVGRGRVDLRVSRFNMLLEALVTDAHTLGTRTSQNRLLEHILRLLQTDTLEARYGLSFSDFRILHFQRRGNSVERPMDNWDDQTKQVFDSKVLTWLMSTKQLFLGQKEILPLKLVAPEILTIVPHYERWRYARVTM
eukprot:g14321.t1